MSSQSLVEEYSPVRFEEIEPSPISLTGYLNFREYKSGRLYDLSLSPQEEDQKWEFVVGFLVKYETNKKISPILQVWEKYQKGMHCRKVNLVSVNGEILRDMAKLTWRQPPEWTSELELMIREKTIEFIKNDYSEEYESEFEIEKNNCLSFPVLLPIVKAHFDQYATKLFASILDEHSYKNKWKYWEIPFGDTAFLLRSQCVRSGTAVNFVSPSQYIKDNLFGRDFNARLSYFKDFLIQTSRAIAVNSYPEFLSSVTDRDVESGDVYLPGVKLDK